MLKTVIIVWRCRPDILFVQNPSMLLAVFATCFVKPILRIPIVVDRHSNFLLFDKKQPLLKRIVFNLLSNLSIYNADLTIVTNDFLANHIDISGGRPFVLPDKLPDLKSDSSNERMDGGGMSLLVISSFGKDEPFPEIWKAVELADLSNLKVFVTGDFRKLAVDLVREKPKNVELTGFIPDNEFDQLLMDVDAVMVLTTVEYVLLCGCYEAVSAEKPLITSSTMVLKDLFDEAIFVEPDFESIAHGIKRCFSDLLSNKNKTIAMKRTIGAEWNEKFGLLGSIVNNF